MNANAKRVLYNFNRRFKRLTIKTRRGDTEAALKVIKLLTEQNVTMRKLGYIHNGEDAPDGEWLTIARYNKLYGERDNSLQELAKKARNGDAKAAIELVKNLATGNGDKSV